MSAAQDFLDQQLDKNKYTIKQQETLEASGGPSTVGSSHGTTPSGEAYEPTPSPRRGGGTERYADYDNTNNGLTAFTDTWQDGAKYQQLRGSGVLTNKDFDAQFASAKGGADTGTVADDGGEWKLIRQDEGEKTHERRLQYKDIAKQWQDAGYDVRVQDHNPDFAGGTGEIAVRVGQAKTESEPEKEPTPIEHSPEVQQATERVRAYEDDVMSGKTSDDIFGDTYGNTGLNLDGDFENDKQLGVLDRINEKYQMDFNYGAKGIGTPAEANVTTANKATDNFLESKKSQYKTGFNFKPSTSKYGAD